MPSRVIWKIQNREILFDRTLIMGVINLTPDSFSDGGLYYNSDDAVAQALQCTEQGADILDFGAESTRPGARPVSAEEELRRILPVLTRLKNLAAIPVSIDTTKPEVARRCLAEGADIINDVSGLKDSGPAMAQAVREYRAGLILMHRRGDPETMQSLAAYHDVTAETIDELLGSVNIALDHGLGLEQLAVDPGVGFAKTAEHSLRIVQELEKFHGFQRPVILGPSRKSFIGAVTGREVGNREFGTAAVVAAAVAKGVHIVRVHNVAAMRDVVRMAEALKENQHVRSL